MDFTFSEEQRMMAAALRELSEDVCAPRRLRELFDGRDAGAEQRWTRLAEMGLFGVRAPEASGGLALQDADFILLAEESGRAALPEPLVEQAALAVPALAELIDEPAAAEVLPALAVGRARVAVTHPQNVRASVPPGVTHWLLCTADTTTLAQAGEVSAVATPSVDAGRRLFEPASVRGEAKTLARGTRARQVAARLLNRGAVFTAAQCLGLTERMLGLTAEYAKERTQFGKPIGAYQAIKHQLASVAVKLEFARPVVYAAVTRLEHDGPHADVAASHAKLAAVAAADLAARTGIQVHGAMGYSWEVDLHFYMKRAWALAGSWGDHNFHARRVQTLVCGGALALGPDQTFARTA
jgi:alkylation response protein AidB-like acyl-CoA dehydrogenase